MMHNFQWFWVFISDLRLMTKPGNSIMPNLLLHRMPICTYWISEYYYIYTAARQIIRQLLRKCITCQWVIAKPYQAPDPATLTVTRTQASRPFQVTGADFTGTLYVRSTDAEKRFMYVCLHVLLQEQYT